jgi:cyclopropane-fatty-acyl-phospholipid synthase
MWWLLDKALHRLIHRGELVIIDHRGYSRRYGSPHPDIESVTVRFADARLPFQILHNMQLAVPEAYMNGRLIFEHGDITQLLMLVSLNRRWEELPPAHSARRWASNFRTTARNSIRRSRRNVAHHYDIGNALYRLFLDDDLQYSCAYFLDPSNSLEQAQADKKARIAAKLHLQPGHRVLDIGCGWGGLALYLHRTYGVDVLGITLSEEQLALARQRAEEAGVAERVQFELLDYRSVTGAFDRIVSVGMFEHVGPAHYDTFFRTCRSLLKPDGVMLLHTIGRFDFPVSGDPFPEKYIFPGYHLPNMSQLVQACERAHLITADVETLRLHYAWTLNQWLARTREHRDEIVSLFDERFYRMWEVYLAAAKAMFEAGAGCVFQVQLIRDRHALPVTRGYMGAEFARLSSTAPLD